MSFPEANDPKALLNTNRDSFLPYREKIELGTTKELPNCCRLFDHQDDPDIDEPYQAPQGHVLGKEATGSQDFVVYMQYIEYLIIYYILNGELYVISLYRFRID